MATVNVAGSVPRPFTSRAAVSRIRLTTTATTAAPATRAAGTRAGATTRGTARSAITARAGIRRAAGTATWFVSAAVSLARSFGRPLTGLVARALTRTGAFARRAI